MDEILERICNSSQLQDLIKLSSCPPETDCDKVTGMHQSCFSKLNENNSQVPKCPKALIYLLIAIMAKKPKLIDDNIKTEVSKYFKMNNTKAHGLISRDTLTLLDTCSQSPLQTWLKFETILIQLIKDQIYEPETMANEVLRTVKDELNPKLAARFSSVLSSCVKHCREIRNQNQGSDEEEEQKWCEIIEWMSWFLGGDDMDGI